MRLLVLTLDETVFDGPIEEVVAPLLDGWLGVRARHAPFQARLLAGDVVLRADGRERTLATLGGTIVVEREGVTILTGVARLDRDLETLEREIGDDIKRRAALEQEAEKHFDRVYRQVARALGPRTRTGGRA
jgi:F-type H+-transporting ATPase subunit epsilon